MPYIRKKPEANQDKRLMRLRMGSARRPTLRNALGKSLPASLWKREGNCRDEGCKGEGRGEHLDLAESLS